MTRFLLALICTVVALPRAAALHIAAVPCVSSSSLRAASLQMAATDMASICRELQAGGAPKDLAGIVGARGTSNKFFKEYFTNEDWAVADEPTPPAALTEGLCMAPESVIEVLLMNVVQGAASQKETMTSRAIILVNSLWDEMRVMPQSCNGLKDAVNAQLGEELPMAADANSGNEETIRMMWSNLLSFLNLEEVQFERARDALARCGGESDGRRYGEGTEVVADVFTGGD